MAVLFSNYLQTPFAFSPRGSIGSPGLNRRQILACSSLHMESNSEGRRNFMEFPYVSAPHRKLMVDLFSAMETRLHSQLLPCTLPPDVQHYQNQTSTANASLQIRSGNEASPVSTAFLDLNFILFAQFCQFSTIIMQPFNFSFLCLTF